VNTQAILDKAVAGERLTFDEGVALFDCRDLNALGRAAHAVTRRLHPEPYRTYNIDRNINYTNVCAAVCDFCAFYRKTGDGEAYVLSREELYRKIDETIALGGDQANGTKRCYAISRPAIRASTCTPSAPRRSGISTS
jgi:cyclic dehypoxanthinyl futalosine synthase